LDALVSLFDSKEWVNDGNVCLHENNAARGIFGAVIEQVSISPYVQYVDYLKNILLYIGTKFASSTYLRITSRRVLRDGALPFIPWKNRKGGFPMQGKMNIEAAVGILAELMVEMDGTLVLLDSLTEKYGDNAVLVDSHYVMIRLLKTFAERIAHVIGELQTWQDMSAPP